MEAQNNHTNTYLSLEIDRELFAVNVEKVLEVLQMQRINRIPNAPGDIAGVTNFRGDIIPVFDTRIRFELPPRQFDEKYVIIVLEVQTKESKTVIGAMVDRVKDVFEIAAGEILPIPKINARLNTEFINGVYKKGGQFIMLLNVDNLFVIAKDEVANELINEA